MAGEIERVDLMMFLRTQIVSEDDWALAHAKNGSVYFIRDVTNDCIKVGHSRDPITRLSTLQVGNSNRLHLVGLVAAEFAIEQHIHRQLMEGHALGEWFYDRGIVTQWLMDMTQGEPLCRYIWALVPGHETFCSWDEKTGSHVKHVWNSAISEWEPPIR